VVTRRQNVAAQSTIVDEIGYKHFEKPATPQDDIAGVTKDFFAGLVRAVQKDMQLLAEPGSRGKE
jgi:hypothetical protein